MNKSIFSVAAFSVFSAFTSNTVAQSDLTIYGVVDVGYINIKTNGTAIIPTESSNTIVFGNSAQQTSRLGFKGTEDLGGGVFAFFTIETDMQPANAFLSRWQDRQSFLGLGMVSLGQFAIGTQNTPIYNQLAATDVGHTNNTPGSAVYPIYSSGGSRATGTFDDNAGVGGVSVALTTRTHSTLSFKTAEVSGFILAGIAIIRSETLSAQLKTQPVPIQDSTSGWGISGQYSQEKFYLGLAYQALKSQNLGYGCAQPGACSSTASTPEPKAWAWAEGGVNTQDNQYYAGATYDFGYFKTYLQYINRKVTNILDASYTLSRSAQQIGFRGFFTTNLESWANIGNGQYTTYGINSPSSKINAWQIGVNYYLSKRTNLYAIYGSDKGGTNSINPATSHSSFASGVRVQF